MQINQSGSININIAMIEVVMKWELKEHKYLEIKDARKVTKCASERSNLKY